MLDSFEDKKTGSHLIRQLNLCQYAPFMESHQSIPGLSVRVRRLRVALWAPGSSAK